MEKDFEEIYNQYFKDVYKFIYSICRNEHVAEEVTQETFFKALKNIDKYNKQCKFYVWLCQIAKNTYFTIYKKNSRNEELSEVMLDNNLLEKMIDKESASPEPPITPESLEVIHFANPYAYFIGLNSA